MPLANALYRARQFVHALVPRIHEHHTADLKSLLGPGERDLFLSMPKRDQKHGFRVMEHLRREGEHDRALLAAALLHDCGKGEISLWLRVPYVIWPRAVEELARGRSEGQAYRLVHHVRLGAEKAAAAGAGDSVVRYISGRVAEHEHAKIASLRAADDRS